MSSHFGDIVTEDSCNCMWRYCESHKGLPCTGTAKGYKCESGCGRIHWIGDRVFGDSIRLCDECARNLMQFLSEEIPKFMGKLSIFVPPKFFDVMNFARQAFLTNMADDHGWREAPRDCRAVLELASLFFVYFQYTQQPYPIFLIDECTAITEKLNTILEDMSGTSVPMPDMKGELS